MSGRRWRRPAPWLSFIGGAVALWAVRRRRRGAAGPLSLPERTLEHGKDAAEVVVETTAELTRPPGGEP